MTRKIPIYSTSLMCIYQERRCEVISVPGKLDATYDEENSSIAAAVIDVLQKQGSSQHESPLSRIV